MPNPGGAGAGGGAYTPPERDDGSQARMEGEVGMDGTDGPRLELHDALAFYGRPEFGESVGMGSLLSAMGAEGIGSAVAASYEQFYAPPDVSNEAAAKAVADEPRLRRLIAMAPTSTGELPAPESVMDAKAAGLLLCPGKLGMVRRPVFLKEWFGFAQDRKVPIWYVLQGNADFEFAADILERYPSLRMVLFHSDSWPNSRKVFPLMDCYGGVCAGTSDIIWMGGIEGYVARFGGGRLVFSTRYPERYVGAAKRALATADIPEADRRRIAGANLLELMGGFAL
ncbi:MAG: hypothetical protein FWE70_06460 [Oscillospiraceae bacterium]|nr:hypothetical protein [Oscillospiraceae bacterium]